MVTSTLQPFARKSLNESPSEKEGKLGYGPLENQLRAALNESPSEKEGKWDASTTVETTFWPPSMKVPPKRKGNPARRS